MSAPDQSYTPDPQLLYVGQQDTSRLLEVYVKRSLSLNDGPSNGRRAGGKHRKWVTLAERNKRERRHSSDTSIHLAVDTEELKNGTFRPIHDDPMPPIESQTEQKPSDQKKSTLKARWMSFRDKGRRPSKPSKIFKPAPPEGKTPLPETTATGSDLEKIEKEDEKRGREKKHKTKDKVKPSFWKRIVGLFSRSDSDSDEQEPIPVKAMRSPQVPMEAVSPLAPSLPTPRPFLGGEEVSQRRKKSTKKRRSRMRRSLKLDRPSSLVVEGVERVEPTDSYYENVSEELKKIVIEVMDSPTDESKAFPPELPPTDTGNSILSTEEVTERLIALIKQQGDFLDAKMKDSPSLTSFFQGLTYGSFQQLADHYVQSEIPTQPVPDQVVAPELVKLAFTLDFTARLASLSRQSPSHIMGLGSRYLQDRFTYETETQLMSPTTELSPGAVHTTT